MAYRRCCCEVCDVETLRTRDKTATPPASWSRDPIRRVAALEELRKDFDLVGVVDVATGRTGRRPDTHARRVPLSRGREGPGGASALGR